MYDSIFLHNLLNSIFLYAILIFTIQEILFLSIYPKTLLLSINSFLLLGFILLCLKLSSFLIFSFFKENDYDGIYRQYCLTMIMMSYTLIFLYSYVYLHHCPLEWEYFIQNSLVEQQVNVCDEHLKSESREEKRKEKDELKNHSIQSV